MPLSDQVQLGLVNRFLVKVDPGDVDLGSWSKVDGLDVTFDVPEYRAGDAWNHRWYFPGHTKYSSVKLSRGANKEDTKKVQTWLSETAKKFKVGTVTVTLHDAHHDDDHPSGHEQLDLDHLDLDELSARIYGRLRRRLRAELLIDRERAGLLTDFR